MIRYGALIAALFHCAFCSARTANQANEGYKCQKEWRYLAISDTLQATVLFDQKAAVSCGIFSAASTTLVRKSNGDTLRVLQMCNMGPNMKKGKLVRIVPGTIPPFRVDMIPYDPKACQVKEAYFGFIER